MISLAGRSIVSISDLTNDEIEGIFRLADRFQRDLQDGPLRLPQRNAKKDASKGLKGQKKAPPRRRPLWNLCADRILATVFLEPSTRTRLSFESAMQRLGGRVISIPDARSSSAAKGERLADAIRVIASYADIIVLRHPNEGAALLATESLDDRRLKELGRCVPVINGGDGAHEHPTQTLCDLYTIRREHRKNIKGLRVALCGDLLHARTVHSLAYGLARFGAELRCISPPELRLPQYVKRRLELEFGCVVGEYNSFEQLAEPGRDDVVYAAEGRGKSRAASRLDLDDARDIIARLLDAVYVTRIQRERFAEASDADAMRGSYLIDTSTLTLIGKRTTIMHPLPRVDEVDSLVDAHPRAAYFRQAGYGVPIRMALIALLLGKRVLRGTQPVSAPTGTARMRDRQACVPKVCCLNATCITNHEPGARPCMVPVPKQPGLLRCVYCDQEQDRTA